MEKRPRRERESLKCETWKLQLLLLGYSINLPLPLQWTLHVIVYIIMQIHRAFHLHLPWRFRILIKINMKFIWIILCCLLFECIISYNRCLMWFWKLIKKKEMSLSKKINSSTITSCQLLNLSLPLNFWSDRWFKNETKQKCVDRIKFLKSC